MTAPSPPGPDPALAGYHRTADLDVYRLEFDEQYPGLWLRAHPPSHAGLVATATAQRVLRDPSRYPPEASVHALDLLVRVFAQALIEWSVLAGPVDAPVPVPATYEEVSGLDQPFLLVVMRAWSDAVTARPRPADPEPDDDDDGIPDIEATMGMSLPPTPAEPPAADDEEHGVLVAELQSAGVGG